MHFIAEITQVNSISIIFQTLATEMTTLGVRVNEVNNEADKMIKAGHPQARMIKNKKRQLNDKYI